MAKKSNADIREEITNKLLKSIENSGKLPWQATWAQGTSTPCNATTGKPYRGINVLILLAASLENEYGDNRWMTYKQAKTLGHVKKGEKGTQIVFWKFLRKKDKDNPDKEAVIPLMRLYTVFNAEQCEGIDAKNSVNNPIEACEDVCRGYTDKPFVGIGEPAYYPGLDKITMPTRDTFNDSQDYYATLFHEFVHSTGHEKRLARTNFMGAESFNNDRERYSFEELVAEMGAAFLCGHTGIQQNQADEDNRVAYLKNWLSYLKSDPDHLLKAAGLAQKAVDYIFNPKPKTD